MNFPEKQHVSRKARMKHPSNLDSFMDETDREVMSLTDRAFKSLCIGDEAIYNDSELFSSPVDCHKPLAEEIPKKPRENSAFDGKKHAAHRNNGMYNTPWQMNKNTTKMSSLFATFIAKKNNVTKMTNGDSWDKSALISIQTELSSDYKNHLMDEHIYKVKSHRKPSEKGTVDQPINSSGKTSKNQHGKSTKLRKLNSKNFFLHSEFSPFQFWGDLNRFGLENVEMFPCNSPAGLYDSPLYTELNSSDRLHRPEPKKRETSQSTSPLEPRNKSKPDSSQCTGQPLKTVSPLPEQHPELNIRKLPAIQPQVLPTSSGSYQRCQSEGDLYAPWRKNRSRAKGVAQPFISSPSCERSNTGDESAVKNKNEVKMVEEAACLNSTPFSISQLLTPVIPSRQGTGTSEILQSIHSPAALDIPALRETEIHPSPDIKREGYKSKASSLLFNLKDNRKRVKATYSPPKFKGLDTAEQNKLSPLIEQDVTKNVLESPEITDSKTALDVQKPNTYPLSPETADIQSSQSSGHINSTLPDDFLGLSLLQAGNRGSPVKPSNAQKNPLAKVTYPSLLLYRKTSPVDVNMKDTPVDVPGSHSKINKSAEQMLGKENLPENHNKKLQRIHQSTKPEINHANHESTQLTHIESADNVLTKTSAPIARKEKSIPAVLKNPNAQQDVPTLSGSRNQDRSHTEEIFKAEERAARHKKYHRNESKAKHFFSARQNNYIKNQRYGNVDDDYAEADMDECEYWQENGVSTGREELRKRELNVDVINDKGEMQGKVDDPYITESITNDDFTKNHYSEPPKNDLVTEHKVAKNEAFSMKGNTSAKVALFTVKEQPSTTLPGSKKSNIVKDRYELATMALEKRIAEREQRKRQSRQDQPAKEDYKQESMLGSGEKETPGSGIAHRQGQSQNVRSMSDIDTNHGECHVPEVKLDGPYKQEGAAKYSPSRLIYPDRDRSDKRGQHDDPSNIRSLADVNELKETVLVSQNQNRIQESPVDQDHIYDTKHITVREHESSVQEKKGSQKPEASRRNQRANSQTEDKAINERQRKEEERDERTVKHEEPLGTEVKISNLQNNQNQNQNEGAVKGHVSSLREKFNKEQVMANFNPQEFLSQGDDFMGYPNNDSKHKEVSPRNTLGFPEIDRFFTKNNHKAEEADSDNKIFPDKDTKSAMGRGENLGGETVNKNVPNDKEERKHETKTEIKTFDVLRETGPQDKSDCYSASSIKQNLTDHVGESGEPGDETEKTPTLSLFNPDNDPVDRITLYDILNQAVPTSSVSVKQSDEGNQLTERSEDSPSLNKQEIKCENLDPKESCSSNNPENKPHNSSRAINSPKDVEKRGWVQCLIDSARNLTPTCQSNASSPAMGKPALFKVKDNTFSASPVTKTVKPILHKTVAGVTQPWSPRESFSGSEKGEEDPDLYKDFGDVPSLSSPSTPVRITQPNLSAIQVVPRPSSQSTTDRETKGHMEGSTVPEKEEWQLNKTAIATEIEGLEIRAGDTVEELAFNPAHTDSIDASKVPSERSPSACSGIENQLQGKPPAVPPKTEKALRRAMKLTTKRIQKAEAKTKSERGRSSEKGSCHEKYERRHQSSDKVLSEKSCHREHSVDRSSNDQSTGLNDSETASLPKSHTCERLAMRQNKPTSHRREKDTVRKLQHRCHSSLNITDSDAKSFGAGKQKGYQLDQSDAQNMHVDCERLGRTTEKSQPHRLYHRAQSLDRFSSSKHEHTRLFSSEDPLPQTAPLRQNSIEHTYGSPANNIVPQAFPMTQRKLLQDLDSGQYFVVDMPVQVKTKTFFDPETGRYVQLPVQSLEGSVPRAQSVEVVNAPSLMLYHGFVPVPVPSLP